MERLDVFLQVMSFYQPFKIINNIYHQNHIRKEFKANLIYQNTKTILFHINKINIFYIAVSLERNFQRKKLRLKSMLIVKNLKLDSSKVIIYTFSTAGLRWNIRRLRINWVTWSRRVSSWWMIVYSLINLKEYQSLNHLFSFHL
jgi:hypothetical protein